MTTVYRSKCILEEDYSSSTSNVSKKNVSPTVSDDDINIWYNIVHSHVTSHNFLENSVSHITRG